MAWFKWRLEIKSKWIRSTKAFNTHWKNLESRNLALKEQHVLNFKSTRHEGSGNELVDYSRAPCLGADQKERGLWERDCFSSQLFSFAHDRGHSVKKAKGLGSTMRRLSERKNVISMREFWLCARL